MFLEFFYRLRENGLDVSMKEWLTLMEGLQKGLHRQSLTGFYNLARAVVVRTESQFDVFDQTFADVFKDVPLEGQVPEEILRALQTPAQELGRDFAEQALQTLLEMPERQKFSELLEKMKKTLEKQKNEEHNGGTKWVGTQGRTGYGNRGWFPGGIRLEGEGMNRSAVSVASGRRFRDFRTDQVLDLRQYQLAFRRLRYFSTEDSRLEKEIDVDGTVRDTADQAGNLKIRMKNPRKNTVKLLLFMDSGGSMEPYSRLCSTIFQAASKNNFFKELHIYYFHNCILDRVFTSPQIVGNKAVETEWVLQNHSRDSKVIIVGDAAMEPEELYDPTYNWETGKYDHYSGYEWMLRVKKRFPHIVWLNPEPLPTFNNYLTQTHLDLAAQFPMYRLSVDGLEKGIKKLMSGV